MIKAIIIEDELNNRELLHQMLTEYCEEVDVVGMAVNVSSGIEMIKELNPEVIFLDIEIPGGTGFDILKAFDRPSFKIIFVTGYDHYAIKAIKYAALDYLLKPVELGELREAIEKVKLSKEIYLKKIDFFKDQIGKTPEETRNIVLSNYNQHKIIKFEDIVFVEAERTYSTFHLDGDKTQIASNPMNFYEDLLPKSNFFRIHKSYIINCLKVEKLDAGRGGQVHLVNGSSIPIAFRRKSAFIRFLEKLK